MMEKAAIEMVTEGYAGQSRCQLLDALATLHVLYAGRGDELTSLEAKTRDMRKAMSRASYRLTCATEFGVSAGATADIKDAKGLLDAALEIGGAA